MTYETNKCLYQLPPFDQHFDPLVHNKYLSRSVPEDLNRDNTEWFRKAKLLERQAKMEERSFNFEQHLKRRKRTTNNFGKFTYKKCLLETLIIGKALNPKTFLTDCFQFMQCIWKFKILYSLVDIRNSFYSGILSTKMDI